MLNRIEVESFLPGATSLPIGDGAGNDPIQIRDISGLGPVKAALSSIPYATSRGSYYNGGSIPDRNIVLTLGLNPNWQDQTVASLRKLLYGYFLPEQWCKLRFFTDEYQDVQIEGICESVEPNIFSQDPEILVSIINHQPDFVAVDGSIFLGNVTNALVDGTPTEYTFDYEGTAPAGFVLKVKTTEDNEEYTGRLLVVLDNYEGQQTFELTEFTIDATKYLLFGSLDNDRKITTLDYENDEVVDELLKQVVSGSSWMKFKPGENILAVNAEENFLDFELRYFTRFGGL